MSVGVLLPKKMKNSRRIRRVVWTVSSLAVLLLVGAIATWRIHKENEPEEYLPGEASQDITSVLSNRGATTKSATFKAVEHLVNKRVVDRLVDPGRKLPPGAPEPLFTDVSKAAGLGFFRQFEGARSSQLPEDMGSGVAWGDFDDDGFDDLFVVSGGGALDLSDSQLAPSVLYRNLGDGRLEKVQDFPDLRIRGMAASWGDYNNDGWLDLVVTGYDTIILFRNEHGHLVRD